MNVRDFVLGNAGRARFGQRRPLRDTLTALHEKRPEMGQRNLVAIGVNRDSEPVRRNLTGEGDLAGNRRIDLAGAVESDVDTAMLSPGVGVVAERELAEDVAVCRPRPCAGARRESERQADHRHGHSEHSRCPRR